MAEEYKIVVRKDVRELEQLGRELETQRKKEIEAQKTGNKILFEQEKQKTSLIKGQIQERLSEINNAIQKEIAIRKEATKLTSILEKETTKRQKIESDQRTEAEKLNYKKQVDAKRDAEKEKQRLDKETKEKQKATERELTKQSKFDSKFTGQFSQLGSVDALTQQISHFKKLRDSVSITSSEFQTYQGKVNALTSAKRNLLTQTRANIFGIAEFGENIVTIGAGIVGLIALVIQLTKAMAQFVVSTSKAGADLGVLRANFKGTAEDIELFKKATAGTVTEANLIKLSNQASDLGISLRDQALFFSLAEDAADKYGGSVEENFMRIVLATEGNIKGLKSLGIQKAEYEKTVTSMVKAQGGEIEVLKGLHGEQEITIKNLDAETQKTIRKDAVLKLSGITLADVTAKQKDNADKIRATEIAVEDFRTELGLAFTNELFTRIDKISSAFEKLGFKGETAKKGVDKFKEAIGNLSVTMLIGQPFTVFINNLEKIIDAHKRVFNAVQSSIDKIKEFFNAFDKTGNALGMTSFVKIIIQALDGLIQKVIKTVQFLKSTGLFPFLPDVQQQASAIDPYHNYGEQISPQNKPTSDKKDKSGNKSGTKRDPLQEFLDSIDLSIRSAELQKEFQEINREQLLNILQNKEKELKTGEKLAKNDKDRVTLLDKQVSLMKKIEEIQKSIFGDSPLAFKLSKIDLEALSTKIQMQVFRETPGGRRDFSPAQRLSEIDKEEEARRLGIKGIIHEVVDEISGSISEMMAVLNIGADTFVGKLLNGFDKVLQTITLVIRIINSIQTINGLLSLIPFLADGGEVVSGKPHIVGERGAELFVPNSNGYVYSNRELSQMVGNANNQSIGNMINNIYLNASVNSELVVSKGTKAMNQTNRYRKVG